MSLDISGNTSDTSRESPNCLFLDCYPTDMCVHPVLLLVLDNRK